MPKTAALCGLALLCLTLNTTQAQSIDSLADKAASFPTKLLGRIRSQANRLNDRLTRQSQRYIAKLMDNERQLKAQLTKTDSNAAKTLFWQDPEGKYRDLLRQLHSDSLRSSKLTGQYLPNCDSAQGILLYLSQHPDRLPAGISPDKLKETLASVQQLQAKLNTDEQLRQFIVERKEQIAQVLRLQPAVSKEIQQLYGNYNQQLYYYSSQLQAYREMLNDPDKMLSTALKVLNRVPAFAQFIKSNSYLSGLFPASAAGGASASVYGMQTRDGINDMVKNQVTAGGSGAASAFSDGMQSAQAQLDDLKSKLSSLGSGGADADLPNNFQPNNQRTKTFGHRLQYGANIQTAGSTALFPVSTEFGASIGYKLNNKSVIGLGASYRMGWGSDIQHIHLSGQGIGLRSFLDWKLKGSIYASGGVEYNYQPLDNDGFKVNSWKDWRPSGLLGIGKTFPVNNRFFKNTTVQLLWDFLSYQQKPQTQPFLFRLGYSF